MTDRVQQENLGQFLPVVRVLVRGCMLGKAANRRKGELKGSLGLRSDGKIHFLGSFRRSGSIREVVLLTKQNFLWAILSEFKYILVAHTRIPKRPSTCNHEKLALALKVPRTWG